MKRWSYEKIMAMLIVLCLVFPCTISAAGYPDNPAGVNLQASPGMPIPPGWDVDVERPVEFSASRWVERWDPTRPEEVLVVYNTSYTVDSNGNSIPDGQEIAEYYQAARSIPAINICPITCATAEVINRTEYDTNIRPAIESYLTANGLTYNINYIVLTKGIPLKIPATGGTGYGVADYASVDSSLMLLFQSYSIVWRQNNPYYAADTGHNMNRRFECYGYTNGSGVTLSYLTSRLDGYTMDDIFDMIDRGLTPYTGGGGTYVLDDHQLGYDRMPQAYNVLHGMGEVTNPDPWVDSLDWITSDGGIGVMGYCSHGVHAGMPDGYIQSTLTFSYLSGALFNTYESFNAYGFVSPTQNSHGQVAEFIMMGGTGGVGHCYEPWSDAVANESILFPAYAAGYSLADAIHMGLPFTDFVNVVVGDPMAIIMNFTTPTPLPTSTPPPTVTPQATTTPQPPDTPAIGIFGIGILVVLLGAFLSMSRRTRQGTE
ncbi:TIGR03790 family protein [bacterium]|nr:TIGR03790 family protein [candidate division CSSED10-310 bacterium]